MIVRPDVMQVAIALITVAERDREFDRKTVDALFADLPGEDHPGVAVAVAAIAKEFARQWARFDPEGPRVMMEELGMIATASAAGLPVTIVVDPDEDGG